MRDAIMRIKAMKVEIETPIQWLFISDFNFRVNVAGIRKMGETGKWFGSPAALLSSTVSTVVFSAVRFNIWAR